MNALVPSYHCLHTPGGPLQYSLEGHPFAPFGIGMTSDAAYLVSVSNLFVIWDLSTGDVFRQINPGIQGIMQNLCISPDDKYAVSYTNNNQVCASKYVKYCIRIIHRNHAIWHNYAILKKRYCYCNTCNDYYFFEQVYHKILKISTIYSGTVIILLNNNPSICTQNKL